MMAVEAPISRRRHVTVDGRRHIEVEPGTLYALASDIDAEVDLPDEPTGYATLRVDQVRFAAAFGVES